MKIKHPAYWRSYKARRAFLIATLPLQLLTFPVMILVCASGAFWEELRDSFRYWVKGFSDMWAKDHRGDWR